MGYVLGFFLMLLLLGLGMGDGSHSIAWLRDHPDYAATMARLCRHNENPKIIPDCVSLGITHHQQSGH